MAAVAKDRLDTLLDAMAKLSISISEIPLARCGTATITVSANVVTTSVLIKAANPLRLGLVIYNNSTNSGYVSFGSAANSGNNMTFVIATFASLIIPVPIYTGAIYAIRNGAGTGTFILTEFTA